MAERGRSQDFKTPLARISYAQSLFKPQERTGAKGTFDEYNCTLIWPKSDKALLEKYVIEAIRAEWGDKGVQQYQNELVKSPILDGGGKQARDKQTGEFKDGLGPDVIFARPNSRRAPFVAWKSAMVPATRDEVYSGCYGFAVLNAYAWESDQGRGVSFGISMFQKTKEGDRLGGGGGVDPGRWFEAIADAGEAPSETKSGKGAEGLFA